MAKTYEFKRNGRYTVTLDDNFITITSKGVINFFNLGSSSSKKILYKNILGVDFKNSGALPGYLQILIAGSKENKGLLKASENENTIMFSGKKGNEDANEIRDFIEQKLVELHQNTQVESVVEKTIADKILDAQNLYKNGIITEDEFKKIKEKIINN